MRCAVCGVQSAVCGVRCAVCGVRCAVCGVRCAVCGVRSVVCGAQGAGRTGCTWMASFVGTLCTRLITAYTAASLMTVTVMESAPLDSRTAMSCPENRGADSAMNTCRRAEEEGDV